MVGKCFIIYENIFLTIHQNLADIDGFILKCLKRHPENQELLGEVHVCFPHLCWFIRFLSKFRYNSAMANTEFILVEVCS